MFPIIDDELLKFMLFAYLSIRLYYDFIYKLIRYMIGGGNK
jgi:hypothetical protein